jgi:hypothetical protein
MKFVFIVKHRNIWPVAWLCDAMGVSRSGFHAWLNRSPSDRSRSDEAVGRLRQGRILMSVHSVPRESWGFADRCSRPGPNGQPPES